MIARIFIVGFVLFSAVHAGVCGNYVAGVYELLLAFFIAWSEKNL